MGKCVSMPQLVISNNYKFKLIKLIQPAVVVTARVHHPRTGHRRVVKQVKAILTLVDVKNIVVIEYQEMIV